MKDERFSFYNFTWQDLLLGVRVGGCILYVTEFRGVGANASLGPSPSEINPTCSIFVFVETKHDLIHTFFLQTFATLMSVKPYSCC